MNGGKKTLNILYVSSTGERGGVERFIESVIFEHNPKIVRPVVLTFQKGSWLDQLKQRGVSAHCIHNARLRQPLRLFRETSHILKSENIDLVHSAYSWSHALISPSAILRGCDRIWMHHGPISDRRWQGFTPLIPASLLLTNSEFMAKKLAKSWHLAKELGIVYYGLDAEEFAPDLGSRQKFRNFYNLKDSDLAVGIVGFLDTWKGQDVFLEAVLQLKKIAVPIRAFVIGGPRQGLAAERCLAFQEKLRSFARENSLEDRVTFTNHIDIKETGALDGLDIFVHASTEPEPFGMVLLEAMAKEKPIIASGEGGPCEILTNRENGLLIEPRCPENLAKAIQCLCNDSNLRINLAKQARRTVMTRFHPTEAARKLEKYYMQVCGC